MATLIPRRKNANTINIHGYHQANFAWNKNKTNAQTAMPNIAIALTVKASGRANLLLSNIESLLSRVSACTIIAVNKRNKASYQDQMLPVVRNANGACIIFAERYR